jgi:NAD(P)-dependent dehydrogenase (short-subunit alcohol dehydrogenase family)
MTSEVIDGPAPHREDGGDITNRVYRDKERPVGVIDNTVAVITGGTSGIGARTAELFAAEGATVIIAGRRRDVGEALAARLGPAVSFVPADVSVEADVENMIRNALDRFGRVDCLINNAGDFCFDGSVATLDLDQFQHTMAVHVGGVVAGMKHVAPVMLRQGSGSIINVASIGGRLAGWTGLGYSAAKAAVLHLTRCAAVELGQHGVRVNSISPGPILTGIFGKGAGMDPGDADRDAGRLEPIFTAALGNWQAIPRAGITDDVAPAALWLASDASSFVNGHDLVVDGGISAGRPASVSAAEGAALAQILAPRAA